MKILVVSDSHGFNDYLWQAINIEKPYDMLVHCGDFGDDLELIRFKADSAFYAVKGNNDYFADAPRECLFSASGKNVLVVHGDRDGVYSGVDRLVYKGLEKNADIILFGHTHYPYNKSVEGIRLINPGSLTYPRQNGHAPSYAVVEIDDNGKVTSDIKYLC